ncbi:MAG: EamA family transporter [Candidatus Saganbacteria bacterium]|nr:EamA family transporter [Candidatus Saganbacteria bacterium]
MKTLITLIIAYSLLLGSSQVILKLGINHLGGLRFRELGDLFPIIWRSLHSFPIMLGIIMMGLSFLVWFYILSMFKLSVAFPLSSMTFIFTVFMAGFFLGEPLTIYNVIGTLIICGGVAMLLYK